MVNNQLTTVKQAALRPPLSLPPTNCPEGIYTGRLGAECSCIQEGTRQGGCKGSLLKVIHPAVHNSTVQQPTHLPHQQAPPMPVRGSRQGHPGRTNHAPEKAEHRRQKEKTNRKKWYRMKRRRYIHIYVDRQKKEGRNMVSTQNSNEIHPHQKVVGHTRKAAESIHGKTNEGRVEAYK
jgi:hypothetical protein